MREQILDKFVIIEGMQTTINKIKKSEPVELTFNFKKRISRELAEDIISQCIELEYGRTPSNEELSCLLDYAVPITINERPISNNDINKIVSECMAQIDEWTIRDCIDTL